MELKKLLKVYEQQGDFFKSKATFPLAFRLEMLAQLKKMLKKNETNLLQALKKDLGKHASESFMTELGLVYQSIRQAEKKLVKWARPRKVKTPIYLWPAHSLIQPVPFGQVLIISPFNYPVLLSLDPLIGSIAGGNVSLVALSEFTPSVNSVLLGSVAEFFPKNYIHFFVSEAELNHQLFQQPFDKIFFTGSPRVGRIVAEAAGKNLTPVTLELGGKSPALVTETANLPLAAERIVWGKFLNAGQTCVAPDYCLVPTTMAERFLNLVEVKVQTFFGFNPQLSPDYGRIVTSKHLNRLTDLLEKDEAYVIKGNKVDENERYLSPTILSTDLRTVQEGKLTTMREEIFGPILPIITYDSLEEALALLQEFEPPLAFYPFSQDQDLLNKLLIEIPFGGATINDTVLHLSNHNLPFGGIGESGMGHYHGEASFKTFSHEKSILWRRNYLPLKIMQPPYTTFKTKLIRKFLK